MKTVLLKSVLLAGLVGLSASVIRAGEEDDLIAILQSSADAPAKCAACQNLRTVGTARSVPALAALLGEERTSQAARYALEAMPGPEAVAAMRKALGRTSGLLKAGLIDSLGWRHDRGSVPLLVPLLTSGDTAVAAAAAGALGHIGGKKAIAALVAAQANAAPAVRPAVLNGLLQCAETLLAAGDAKRSAKLYRSLFSAGCPEVIRVAAWRGLAIADSRQRPNLLKQALAGQDRPLRVAALNLLRELNDAAVLEACLREWPVLPAEAQLAVLDVQVKFGREVLPTARLAVDNPHLALRVAGCQALADLGDPRSLPTLARISARGETAEREAARDALTRVRGPGVREALFTCLANAEPPEKAELLRALGGRRDKEAAPVLLQSADSGPGQVRLAALDSLRILALADTAVPLLRLAARSGSEAEREPPLKALYAVCQASSDKDRMTGQLVDVMGRLPVTERQRVLPVLAELGTPAALEATEAGVREQDPEFVKESVRVLGQWPNAAPAAILLELARTSAAPAVRVLAVRGGIAVTGQEPDTAKRLTLLQEAMNAAKRPEEKKQALGQIGQLPTPDALAVVLGALAEPGLENEAGLAAVTIAEKLAGTNTALAEETATKVLAQCKTPEIVKRAWAIRGKAVSPGPFIQEWLVSGPYSKPGAAGAPAQFDILFGPERPGERVEWHSVPRGDGVNLSSLFPGKENCAAYLKARVVAPESCDALLLLGSDDGVKAWLNGAVVHANNVDRGDTPDQDIAPIRLNKGANELMLKITQGGGGWSAHARIVGSDGKPIPGLQVASQAGPDPT